MSYIWLLTYALPMMLGYFTRKYFGKYFIYYTHAMILLSTALSWVFIEQFNWGFNPYLLAALSVAIFISIIFTRQIAFSLSAIMQEMYILSAVAIAPTYAYIPIVLLFALMHTTWNGKILTLLLGSISIFLYLYFDTVMYSFVLHILALTGLMYFRDKNNLGFTYRPLSS